MSCPDHPLDHIPHRLKVPLRGFPELVHVEVGPWERELARRVG